MNQNENITSDIGSLFKNSRLSDIKFEIQIKNDESKIIHAHSTILGARSSIFSEKFEENLGLKKLIPIIDADAKYFENFLKFCYTDECDLNGENILGMLRLAETYKINVLVKKCLKWLKFLLTINSALECLDKSLIIDNKALIDLILEFISNNFLDILARENFKKISKNALNLILKLSDINIPVDEIDVFDAAIRWSEAACLKENIPINCGNKRKMLGDTFYQIRFPLMTHEEFVKCEEEHNGLINPSQSFNILKSITLKKNISEFESTKRNSKPLLIEMLSNPIELNLLDKWISSQPSKPLNKFCIFSIDKKIILTGLQTNCSKHQLNIKIYSSQLNSNAFTLMYDCAKIEKEINENDGEYINYLENQEFLLSPFKKYKIDFNFDGEINCTFDEEKMISNVIRNRAGINFNFIVPSSYVKCIDFKIFNNKDN